MAYRYLLSLLCLLFLVLPASAQDDSPDLDALARIVAADNQTYGNITWWQGGQIGSLDIPMAIAYGQKLPGFALYDISGEPVILDRIDGPKLVNFWATWCGPCIMEFPLLAEAAQAEDRPFEIIFVNVWDSVTAARDFAAGQPDPLNILLEGDPVSELAGVTGIPTSLLIDSDGIVHAIHVGNITHPVLEFLQALAREIE